MQNKDKWRPTKYLYKKEKLRASRDYREVGISSRLITDLIAEVYNVELKKYFKGKLLDLGCGKVPLFEFYKNCTSEVICADWEKSLHDNEFIDKITDLNQNLDFNNSDFDTVLLSDVLEHILYPHNLMREIYRILKPEGCLIINVPFFYCLHEEPFDYYRYTKFALSDLAKNSGLKIIELRAYGGVLEILADLISKIVIIIPFVGKIISSLVQKMDWLFLKTKLGNRISKKSSEKFPLGYYMVAQKVM
jgi:SAM-dependent methyltransferase